MELTSFSSSRSESLYCIRVVFDSPPKKMPQWRVTSIRFVVFCYCSKMCFCLVFLIKIMFVALIFHCSKFSLKPIVRGQTEDFRGTSAFHAQCNREASSGPNPKGSDHLRTVMEPQYTIRFGGDFRHPNHYLTLWLICLGNEPMNQTQICDDWFLRELNC